MSVADFRQPPRALRGTPAECLLPAGTRLYRIHDKKWASTAFNSRVQDPHFEGTRFDGTREDPYAYYYGALEMKTALAEALLRSQPFEPSRRMRLLPIKSYAGRTASAVLLNRPLRLISLVSAEDLSAVGQTNWLLRSEEYDKTRLWAHWLRREVPWAQGLLWLSNHDFPDGRALVLFGDRCQPEGVGAILRPDPGLRSIDFDDPTGLDWLEDRMLPLRTSVRRRAPLVI